MYDFWFTLGTAIMHPGFLETATAEAPPCFRRIVRVTTEIPLPAGSGPACTYQNAISAGLLEKCTAKAFRLALRCGLRRLSDAGKNPPPPPTSIYTVGRLTQLIKTPILNFMGEAGNLAAAQRAFADAGGYDLKSMSPAFPAFLGLCLIDGVIRSMHNPLTVQIDAAHVRVPQGMCFATLDDCPDDPDVELPRFLEEFQLSCDQKDPQRVVITNFIDLTRNVVRNLLDRDGDPWENGCPDWLGYWSPQSDRVIS